MGYSIAETGRPVRCRRQSKAKNKYGRIFFLKIRRKNLIEDRISTVK